MIQYEIVELSEDEPDWRYRETLSLEEAAVRFRGEVEDSSFYVQPNPNPDITVISGGSDEAMTSVTFTGSSTEMAPLVEILNQWKDEHPFS